MPFKSCPECNKKIHETAFFCPHCGAQFSIKTKRKWHHIVIMIISTIVLIYMLIHFPDVFKEALTR